MAGLSPVGGFGLQPLFDPVHVRLLPAFHPANHDRLEDAGDLAFHFDPIRAGRPGAPVDGLEAVRSPEVDGSLGGLEGVAPARLHLGRLQDGLGLDAEVRLLDQPALILRDARRLGTVEGPADDTVKYRTVLPGTFPLREEPVS